MSKQTQSKSFEDVADLIRERLNDIDDNGDIADLFNERFAVDDERLEYDIDSGEFILTTGAIDEFAEEIASEHEGRTCYIATMEAGSTESGNIELEVEISQGEIAGTFDTQTSSPDRAQWTAFTLRTALEKRGFKVFFKVFDTREEWESQ